VKKSTNKQTGTANKLLIIVGVLVVLIIVFFAVTGSFKFDVYTDKSAQIPQDQSVAEEPKTFEQAGVSFNYPGNWESRDLDVGLGGFFSPLEENSDTFRENVIIHKVDVSVRPDITLEEITDSVIKENEEDFATTGTFELVDRSPTTLGGIDAEKVTYLAGNANLADGKAMSIVALKSNFAYIINYTAEQKSFDKFLPGAEMIISTFQVQ
jgi:hypothetical protein